MAVGKAVEAGAQDAGDRATLRDAIDLGRLGLGLRRVHASAHIGIEREIEDLQQQFPLVGSGRSIVSTLKSLAFGSPRGLAASTTTGGRGKKCFRDAHARTAPRSATRWL